MLTTASLVSFQSARAKIRVFSVKRLWAAVSIILVVSTVSHSRAECVDTNKAEPSVEHRRSRLAA